MSAPGTMKKILDPKAKKLLSTLEGHLSTFTVPNALVALELCQKAVSTIGIKDAAEKITLSELGVFMKKLGGHTR